MEADGETFCRNGGTKFQRESSTDVSGPPERIKFKNVDLVESHIGHAKERARKYAHVNFILYLHVAPGT